MVDFVQYWAAFRVLLDGGNPYDPSVLLHYQQHVFPHLQTPMMTWNPPWTSLLMSWFLWLPYEQAFWLWQMISVILFGVSVWLMRKCIAGWKILLLLPLPVVFESLRLGQLGAVITISTVCLYRGVTEKNTRLFLLGLLLASVKPHLFLVFCGVVFCKKAYFRKTTIALGMFSTLLILNEVILPGSLLQWGRSFTQQSVDGAIHLFRWEPASLVYLIDHYISEGYISRVLLTKLLPFITIAIIFPFIHTFTTRSTAILLGMSYLFSGYGWIFDQGIFLPLRLLAVSCMPTLFITAEIISCICWFVLAHFHQQAVWYALLQTFIGAMAILFTPREQSVSSQNFSSER